MNKNDSLKFTKLSFYSFYFQICTKKHLFLFANSEKDVYLCNRYPENNLFTLKKLIPIED